MLTHTSYWHKGHSLYGAFENENKAATSVAPGSALATRNERRMAIVDNSANAWLWHLIGIW